MSLKNPKMMMNRFQGLFKKPLLWVLLILALGGATGICGDGMDDLADTARALQVTVDKSAPGAVDLDDEVNGDSRIGNPEALFALQYTSDLRYRNVPLQNTVSEVQPMTGIVLWTDSADNQSDAIQLEYAYVGYDTLVTGAGVYDWSFLDTLLTQVAGRGHQAIIRMYFVYPGDPTSVPQYIKALPAYNETLGQSEGQQTWFPDWAHAGLKNCVLDFYTAFAQRYDNDPRLAFLQVGFGLWAEYHIYDGPMVLGSTFPDKAFQAGFLSHLEVAFSSLKWSFSIDAADTDVSPFGITPALLNLGFGLFDDSFLHQTHYEYNADCFAFFGYQNRFALAPMGGELSYYTDHDQRTALDPTGPHGIPFEQLAAQYRISYMIGNDQPSYQPMSRIKSAGMATGYRFRITTFQRSASGYRGVIENAGIAPIYYDAFVSVNGIRAGQSLKGLLPGDSLTFKVSTAGSVDTAGPSPQVIIDCDRLVPGQVIQFEANLIE